MDPYQALALKRQEAFEAIADEVINPESKPQAISLLSLIMFNRLRRRDRNPIYGAKTARNVLASLMLPMVRKFLVEMPYQIIEMILKGEVDDDIIDRYGPNLNLSHPCVYLSRFDRGQLTYRDMGRIVLVLQDPDETRDAWYRVCDTNIIDNPVPVAAPSLQAVELLARNWLDALDILGLDIDQVDDMNLMAWDSVCPFKIFYADYANNHIQRFKWHNNCILLRYY
jgi:hypothetical protein